MERKGGRYEQLEDGEREVGTETERDKLRGNADPGGGNRDS